LRVSAVRSLGLGGFAEGLAVVFLVAFEAVDFLPRVRAVFFAVVFFLGLIVLSLLRGIPQFMRYKLNPSA
jgi:hypothetical protein